jgi:hypothetical protein
VLRLTKAPELLMSIPYGVRISKTLWRKEIFGAASISAIARTF